MRTYKPRRAAARWLDADCPSEVLAIFDHPEELDRFTVFYNDPNEYRGEVWVSYRGMSEHPANPQGFGISSEMRAREAAGYRYRNSHYAATWSSLPDEVKAIVQRDCEAIRIPEVTKESK